MQLHLHKTCYLMKISQENFCILTRFFLRQNNTKLRCSKLLRHYEINPRLSLQSNDLIWRHVTLLSSAAHKRTHRPQLNQQHTGSVDVQLSTRLLQSDILCTITTCNVRSVGRFILNPSVYTCCTNIFIKSTWNS